MKDNVIADELEEVLPEIGEKSVLLISALLQKLKEIDF